jgi:hypothetical protein
MHHVFFHVSVHGFQSTKYYKTDHCHVAFRSSALEMLLPMQQPILRALETVTLSGSSSG